MNKTNLVFMGASIDELIRTHKPNDYYCFLEGLGGCYSVATPSHVDGVKLISDNKDLFSEILESCTEHLSPYEVNFDMFINTLFVNLLCKFVNFHRDEIENSIIGSYSPTSQAMKYALPNVKVTQHSDSVFFDEKGNKYLVFTQDEYDELKRNKILEDLYKKCSEDIISFMDVEKYVLTQMASNTLENLFNGLTKIKSVYVKESYVIFMCKNDYNF